MTDSCIFYYKTPIFILNCVDVSMESGESYTKKKIKCQTFFWNHPYVPKKNTYQFTGMVANLVPVILRNTVGNAVFLGVAYRFVASGISTKK